MDSNKQSSITTNLKILKWNCYAISNKLDDLKSIADEYDIILISETWLHTEKTFGGGGGGVFL